jgi:hypothetical protein
MKPVVSTVVLLGVLSMGCSAGVVVATTATLEDDSTTTSVLPATSTTLLHTTTTTTSRPKEVRLVVDSLPESLVVASGDLTIFGYASPGVTVAAGGVQTSTAPGGPIVDGEPLSYFQLTVRLQPGENVLAITATGPGGEVTAATRTVTYLPDAIEQLAFLTEVSASEVVADYAQFLTGEAADEAAIEAGDIPPGEGVPNGYYILNASNRLRTLPLAATPVVVLPTSSLGPVTDVVVDLDEWLALFDRGRPWGEEENPGDDYFGSGSIRTPYWLTVQDGIVVQIHQQYIP